MYKEDISNEVTAAACHLLFEWAEKLLGMKFSSLKELAAHLLENMYVDNRSVAAFTVLLDASPQLLNKGTASIFKIYNAIFGQALIKLKYF